MRFAYRFSCYLSFDLSSQIQPRVDVVVDCEKKGEDQLFPAVDDKEADNADNDEDNDKDNADNDEDNDKDNADNDEDNDEDNDDDDNDDEAANGTLASNSWQLPLGRSKNRHTLIKFNQPATFFIFQKQNNEIL
jgi:hypothetical protein